MGQKPRGKHPFFIQAQVRINYRGRNSCSPSKKPTTMEELGSPTTVGRQDERGRKFWQVLDLLFPVCALSRVDSQKRERERGDCICRYGIFQ